jgi:hypothetical protein
LFITSENAVKLCFPLYFQLLSKRPWNPYRAFFFFVFGKKWPHKYLSKRSNYFDLLMNNTAVKGTQQSPPVHTIIPKALITI